MATACVPVIFVTQKYRGLHLHDGGILNNLPVEILRENTDGNKCSLLIGVHCNSLDHSISHISYKSELLDRSFEMAIDADIRRRLSTCDLQIEPPNMSRFGMFDLRDLHAIYDVGYRYTKSLKPEIEAFKKLI